LASSRYLKTRCVIAKNLTMAENENFLERWSRRKRDGDDKQALQEEQPPQEQQAALPQDQAVDPDSETQQDAPLDEVEGPQEPAAWESVDIETLGKDSDYTVFMVEGVPDNVKKEALDKLWRSDPVFANLDGLNDYDDDYSKWGIVSQVVKTAYKIGQGYLTDDEVVELQAAREEEDRIAAAERADEAPLDEAHAEDGQPEEAQRDVVAEGESEQSPDADGGDEQSLEQANADGLKPEIIDDEPDEVV